MEMVLLPHKEQFVYMCVFLFTSTCLVYEYTFMKSGFIHFWFVVRYIRCAFVSVHAVFDSNLDYDTHCTIYFRRVHGKSFSVVLCVQHDFLNFSDENNFENKEGRNCSVPVVIITYQIRLYGGKYNFFF